MRANFVTVPAGALSALSACVVVALACACSSSSSSPTHASLGGGGSGDGVGGNAAGGTSGGTSAGGAPVVPAIPAEGNFTWTVKGVSYTSTSSPGSMGDAEYFDSGGYETLSAKTSVAACNLSGHFSGVPPVGSHPISLAGGPGVFVLICDAGDPKAGGATMYGKTGTVSLTVSTSSNLQGTFASGAGPLGPDESTVIVGAFNLDCPSTLVCPK